MAQHNRLIVLDFDHTLFNTTLYVEALKKRFLKLGVTEEEFDSKRQYVKECCRVIDIDRFVEEVAFEKKTELHDTIHQVLTEQAKTFVFSDVGDFIERHSSTHDFLIITQGDEELQTEKISHSQLPGKIPFQITRGAKDVLFQSLVEQYEAVYYIDDKAKHIDEVKEAYPQVQAYFIQRPEDKPYAGTQSTCECADHVISDLSLTLP